MTGVVAVLAIAFLGNRSGKVMTVTAGHGGELLPDAEVIIDHQRRCFGARCTFEASAGVHELTVRAEGYLSQLQLVAMHPGEAAAINFRLERGGSSLVVSGRSEGASLIVDGTWIGRLPMHVDLAPGPHRLRIEADHFLPEERTVELKLGETKRIADIALLPLVGRATIDVRTPDAEVSLVSGSERISHFDPREPIELDLSRQWTLVATKDGFQPLRELLVWGGHDEKTFVVALEKAAAVSVRR